MADENNPQTPPEFEPITSQEEFDRRIKERIARAKASAVPDDYEQVKAEAAQGKEDLAAMTERATKAEAEAAELRHANELAGWKSEVSSKTGVPSGVLRGDTLEEIQAHAEAIKGSIPVYPQVTEGGGNAKPAIGKQQIMEIKNPRERKAAILANLDLFN